jgi:hypothetical protein
MAEADADRLDDYAARRAARNNPTLYLVALRAAAHLRKMRQWRRQRATGGQS